MTPTLSIRFPILRGSHRSRDDGMCAMEMVAWLAGEEHSDGPQCTCPVLAAYVRALNDTLPEDARNELLRPFIPRLIGTRGTQDDELRRGWLIADATARIFAAMQLEQKAQHADARELRDLPVVVDRTTARLAAQTLQACSGVSRSATWVVTRAASGTRPAMYAAPAINAARLISTREWAGAAMHVLHQLVPSRPVTADLSTQ